MAETTLTKLLRIGIDTGVIDASTKKVAELRTQIAKLNLVQEENERITDDENEAYIQNEAIIKALTKEQRQHAEVLKQVVTITNAEVESNEELRASLSVLTAQWNKLSKEQKYGTEVGLALEKRIKGLSDTLKTNEGAIGDNRRSVGGYEVAIKKAMEGVTVFGVDINKTGESMKGMKNAFTTAGGGVKGFSMALATTGIPIIVKGVQMLIGVFSQFKPVVEGVERAISYLTAGFKALISGGSFTEAGKQASQLTGELQDLEDAENGLNIARAEGESKVKQLLISAKDKSKSTKEQIDLINEASTVEAELFEKESKHAIAVANNAEKQFLLKKGINQKELDALINRSTEEEKILAEQVEKKITFDDEELKSFADSRVKIAQISGDSAELREKIQNRLNAVLENAQAEQLKKEEDAEQARKKRAEEKLKEIEKQNQLEFQIRGVLNDFISSELEKQKANEQLAFEQKISAIKGNSQRENDLRVLLKQQLDKKLNEMEVNAQLERDKKRDELAKAERQKQVERENQAFQTAVGLIAQRAELDELVAKNTIKDVKEQQTAITKIKTDALIAELKLTEKYLGASGITTETQKLGLQKIREQIKQLMNTVNAPQQKSLAQSLGITPTDLKEAEQALQEISSMVSQVSEITNNAYQAQINAITNKENAEINAVKNSVGTEESKQKRITAIQKKSAKEKYEIEKKQFEANKAFQITQAILSGALAIVSSLGNTVLPYPLSLIAPITIGAVTASQVALIASTSPPSPPSFKKGGIANAKSGGKFGVFGGKSHSSGGNKFYGEDGSVIETERDELWAVVNKRSTGMLKNLSSLNVAGGGVPFARGGIVNKMENGGFVSPSVSGIYSDAEQSRSFANALKAQQPVLVLEEFQNVSNRQVRTTQRLEL